MGGLLFRKVTPQDLNNTTKSSILDPLNQSDVSRGDFRFIQKLTVTGCNQQQIVWLAENARYSKEKFLIKQIDKIILYDNDRIQKSLKQLQLWKQAYQQTNYAGLFFAQLLFAFQDYQYLYMVYERIQGYTLDIVLKHHSFNEQQTKYMVATLLQIMQFFHERNYSMAELSPEHLIVQKKTGRAKLLQIFNPMPIDIPYSYNIITQPSTYSAPEIIAKNKVLAESDYYTIGCIMYEMMAQKNGILQKLSHLEVIQRHHIISQDFELKKYNLPQGWNPEAADFLVKLLIKNPLYRLGRYGSFQLRFHPWLQNYNWEILNSRQGIKLNQTYFNKNQTRKFLPPVILNISQQERKGMLKDQLFLKYFQGYRYYLDFQKINNSQEKLEIRPVSQHIKTKKSQKYYDSSPSEVQSQNEQQEENLEISEDKSMSMVSKSKKGRGLLNIVEKQKD